MAGTEILGEEILHSGHVRLARLRVRLPDGAVVERELTESGDAACVLPYDPERRLALVIATPRMPVVRAGGAEASLIEAPAGMLDGDSPEDCARREAMEEAGLALHDLEFVAQAWPSPGISAERLSLYLAAFGVHDRRGPGGGAEGEHENIVVREMPLPELWARMNAGDVIDLKTLALVQALKLRRPQLFEG